MGEKKNAMLRLQNETANATGDGSLRTGERQIWIDCLKFLAILAVFVDHTNGLLYSSPVISYASFFSVSVFVFLGGMTSYQSNVKSMHFPWREDIFRRLKRILIPYAIATACYLLYENHVLDLQKYITALIFFNSSAPFYFLVFYLQLILVARSLTQLVVATAKSRHALLLYAGELVAAIIIGALCIRYTFILPVWGGGSFLLGGTYFFLFYAGMVYAKRQENVRPNIVKSSILCPVFLCGIVICVQFIAHDQFAIDAKLKYFGGINPPGISLITYAFLVIGFVRNLDVVLERIHYRALHSIRSAIGWLGQYSLYVFLFHLLIISILRNSGLESINMSIWVKRIVYTACVIAGGCMIGMTLKWIEKRLSGKTH